MVVEDGSGGRGVCRLGGEMASCLASSIVHGESIRHGSIPNFVISVMTS